MKKHLLTLLVLAALTSATVAQVPSYVPSNGLVGWWPFNGNANDESGNGNNGTVNGATLTTDRFGNANAAYDFDGVNDYIDCGDPVNNSLEIQQGVFSISMWLNLGAYSTSTQGLVGKAAGNNVSGDWNLELASTGHLKLAVGYVTGQGSDRRSNTIAPLNNWIYVVGIYSSNNLIDIYINGSLNNGAIIANLGSPSSNTSQRMLFGKSTNFPNNQYFLDGKLDDIGIWNRALTPQEISDLYNSSQPQCLPSYVPSNGLVGWWPFCGNANDESGNGNNGTVNGATLTTDRFGNASAAYDFDGVNDFVQVAHSSSLTFQSDVTFSFWLYQFDYSLNTSGFPERQPIGKQKNTNTSGIGFETVDALGSCCGPQFYITPNPQYEDASPMPLQTWVHMVGTYDGSTLNLFLNGTLLGSATGAANLSTIVADLFFGKEGALGRAYKGHIDDIGIWNRALTQQEVTSLYLGCANPITATITPQGSTAICSGGFVQLVASAGDSYLWSNGATTQTINATQAGQYSVTVTNNDGCTDTSTPVTVSVNPTPSSGVTVGGATTFCTGGSVTLTAQGTGTYLWSNGATSQSITVSQGGNYSVTVTNNGCSATSGVTTVTVNPTPTASIAPQGSTTFCQGGFVVLQASGGGTYQWNTGAQSSSINVSQSGTYTVVVTNNGCTAQAQQQVTVNPLPSVSLQPIAALCANASAVALTGGSPAGGSYTVNGTPATTLNPAQTGSGQQSVAYTYTDGNGCFNTATQSATVNAVPSVSLSGLNTAYLPTDAPVQLNGSPAGGVFNGTGVSNGQFDPAAAGLGTHSVQYAVVDGNGCIGQDGLCTTVDLTTGSGIGLDNGGNGVEVYPNPSNGLFTVVMDGMDGIVQLSVMDIRGREVASQSLTARGRTTHSIDLTGFASGVYTLRIRSAKGTSGIKLVKE